MKEHCLIIFYSYKSKNKGFMEFEKEIKVTGESILKKIKKLGYTRKDMQSLFQNEEYSYLTTDSIDIKNLSDKSADKELLSFNLVKEIAQLMNCEILDRYDSFDFSFPRFMYSDNMLNQEKTYGKNLEHNY